MQTDIPSTFKSANVTIDAFQHVWEPWLPQTPVWESAQKLPPPFDAWGNSVSWKLVECKLKHEDTCEAFTLKAARAHEARAQLLLKNFNLVFGVTRNKQFAAAFRAKKAAAAEAEEEKEESEEDTEEEEENIDEEEEEEEEDDEEEEQEEEEEEEAEKADDEESDDESVKEKQEEELDSESSIEEIKATKKRGPSEKVLHARR